MIEKPRPPKGRGFPGMTTQCYGTLTIGDTTVIKVRIRDASGTIVDGAWGQYGELTAWLSSRGYPKI